MSNGVEDSIRVILWSPVAMIAMGILFAFLVLLHLHCCFQMGKMVGLPLLVSPRLCTPSPFVLFPIFA